MHSHAFGKRFGFSFIVRGARIIVVAGVGFDTDSRSFEWEEAEVEELAEAMA